MRDPLPPRAAWVDNSRAKSGSNAYSFGGVRTNDNTLKKSFDNRPKSGNNRQGQ